MLCHPVLPGHVNLDHLVQPVSATSVLCYPPVSHSLISLGMHSRLPPLPATTTSAHTFLENASLNLGKAAHTDKNAVSTPVCPHQILETLSQHSGVALLHLVPPLVSAGSPGPPSLLPGTHLMGRDKKIWKENSAIKTESLEPDGNNGCHHGNNDLCL